MLIPEKINLLFIEHDEKSASEICSLLRDNKIIKFNIIREKSLAAGIKHLKQSCTFSSSGHHNCGIDVVLLDVVLPNSMGVETYLKVKKICEFLPIVIISEHEDIACECVKLGAQDFLIKSDIVGTVIARSLKYAIERNHLETKRLIAERKVKESESKYRNLVEVTKAGIYEIDFITNKFVYVNDVICKQMGYSKEEMLRMGPKDILTKESYNQWVKRLESLKAGNFIDSVFEYEAVTKDGKRVWSLITAEYIEDKNKNVIGANVVAIDITDKKKAEQEVKRRDELLFNELEKRIYQWKKEIKQRRFIDSKKLELMDRQILSICGSGEFCNG